MTTPDLPQRYLNDMIVSMCEGKENFGEFQMLLSYFPQLSDTGSLNCGGSTPLRF